jgi:plastocyanin
MAPKLWFRASVTMLVLLGVVSSGEAEVIRVEVNKLTYSPNQVSAHVGDRIEWVSKDFVIHTVTAKNADWDATIPAGKSKSVVLTHPGTIDYYCRFHPNMSGRIIVTAN